MYRKIIAVFMACMVVATTLVSPVFATDYQSTYNFWNWAYDNSWFLGKVIIGSADNVCPMSEDTLHHSTNHHAGGLVDGVRQYTCICDTCGQTFSAVATDLANSYDDGSDGFGSIDSSGRMSILGEWIIDTGIGAAFGIAIDDVNNLHVGVDAPVGGVDPSLAIAFAFEMPFDATVCFDGSFQYSFDGVEYIDVFRYLLQKNPGGGGSALGGGSFVDNVRSYDLKPGLQYRYLSNTIRTGKEIDRTVYYRIPSIYILLDDPASKYQQIPVSGGGSISYSDDNSYNEIYDAEFMDFSTNTYHNPVTDYSTKVDNWTYDYSTREFVGYTENGEVKIVYGNEYMSVTENGNIYNYYYSDGGNGSGSGNGSGDGSDGDGLLGKLGELLGTLLGGLIELITGVLNRILDSLISLAEMTIEKLGRIVNLFGSFGDALRTLWSWLPADVVEVLVAGVTVIVFCAVVKLFV